VINNIWQKVKHLQPLGGRGIQCAMVEKAHKRTAAETAAWKERSLRNIARAGVRKKGKKGVTS